MNRALKELQATCLLSGVRMEQTETRKSMTVLMQNKGIYKVAPILMWTTDQVHRYIADNELPYHPLKDQGYVSVGDAHSSRPLGKGETDERATRFGGKTQECGLHIDMPVNDANMLESALGVKKRKAVPVLAYKAFEVYSKQQCKFCVMAKQLLRSKGFEYTEHIVANAEDGEAMCRRIGSRVTKVPQIFIDEQHIGSFPELEVLMKALVAKKMRVEGDERDGAGGGAGAGAGAGMGARAGAGAAAAGEEAAGAADARPRPKPMTPMTPVPTFQSPKSKSSGADAAKPRPKCRTFSADDWVTTQAERRS